MASKADKRRFGQVARLPSGRYRARYADPAGRRTDKGEPVRHSAPTTFETSEDAAAWLRAEENLIRDWHEDRADWTPPAERMAAHRATVATLAEYAPRWVAGRKVRGKPLADRTRDHYLDLLERFILPRFGDTPLPRITPEAVAVWFDTVAPETPTYRAHAYGLLRSIMATAADPTKNNGRPLVPFNPCGIVGGGSASRATRTEPATAEEVATIVGAMPERHRLMVLLADGCGLRYGELAELRRSDVKMPAKNAKPGTSAVLKVRRGVVRSKSAGVIAKAPKSEAGRRDVPVPPHLLPALREHQLKHTAPGADGLLFPGRTGEHLAPSAFYGRASKERRGKDPTKGWGWYEARQVAGRPDLRFHDLRHGALTEAARHGATLAELMALGGHSTSQAAMRYQAAASSRLEDLARKRSEATGWTAEAGE